MNWLLLLLAAYLAIAAYCAGLFNSDETGIGRHLIGLGAGLAWLPLLAIYAVTSLWDRRPRWQSARAIAFVVDRRIEAGKGTRALQVAGHRRWALYLLTEPKPEDPATDVKDPE